MAIIVKIVPIITLKGNSSPKKYSSKLKAEAGTKKI